MLENLIELLTYNDFDTVMRALKVRKLHTVAFYFSISYAVSNRFTRQKTLQIFFFFYFFLSKIILSSSFMELKELKKILDRPTLK